MTMTKQHDRLFSSKGVAAFLARKGIRVDLHAEERFRMNATTYRGYTDAAGERHPEDYLAVSFHGEGFNILWSTTSPDRVLVY